MDTGRDDLRREGLNQADAKFLRELDLRYAGQGYEVRVPVESGRITPSTKQAIADLFHEMHERLRGHRAPEEPIEVVSYRLRVEVEVPQFHQQNRGSLNTSTERPMRSKVCAGCSLRANRTQSKRRFGSVICSSRRDDGRSRDCRAGGRDNGHSARMGLPSGRLWKSATEEASMASIVITEALRSNLQALITEMEHLLVLLAEPRQICARRATAATMMGFDRFGRIVAVTRGGAAAGIYKRLIEAVLAKYGPGGAERR